VCDKVVNIYHILPKVHKTLQKCVKVSETLFESEKEEEIAEVWKKLINY